MWDTHVAFKSAFKVYASGEDRDPAGTRKALHIVACIRHPNNATKQSSLFSVKRTSPGKQGGNRWVWSWEWLQHEQPNWPDQTRPALVRNIELTPTVRTVVHVYRWHQPIQTTEYIDGYVESRAILHVCMSASVHALRGLKSLRYNATFV